MSKFNETTRQFEIAPGSPEVPLVREIVEDGRTTILYDYNRLLMDAQGMFWILPQDGGLYRYDPATQITEKAFNFPYEQVRSLTFAPDGSLYFWINDRQGERKFGRMTSSGAILIQYFPDTGIIMPVALPEEEWPYFSGMLFDQAGRLWLGATGYRDLDAEWHLVNPYPEVIFNLYDEGGYSQSWGPPSLMFESSDGVLWFDKFMDTGVWAEGTAWYDPATGEGCLFTNRPANIIEDHQRQLWLAVDGVLYNYALAS